VRRRRRNFHATSTLADKQGAPVLPLASGGTVALPYRLYADSADIALVSPLLADGLLAGVTTNPTILERGGRGVEDIPELYGRWVGEGAREVFFQAWGGTVEELLATGRFIAELGANAVVKVPATRAGFAAAARLAASGVPVLVTAVYASGQALSAASIGARYIAPYLGRLEDAGRNGAEEIRIMQQLVQGSGTEVLAASLRTPEAIVGLALVGVTCFTAAPSVLVRLLASEASDAAAVEFEAAVERTRRVTPAAV
jgi:transaldolase